MNYKTEEELSNAIEQTTKDFKSKKISKLVFLDKNIELWEYALKQKYISFNKKVKIRINLKLLRQTRDFLKAIK